MYDYPLNAVKRAFDFIAFHAKGSPKIVNGKVRMGMS